MKYLSALRFLALPIAVLILANVIFELVAFDIDKLIGKIAIILSQDESSGRSFLEARARLLWGTSVFIYYATFIAVTIFNILMIRKSLAAKDQIALAAVNVLIVAFILGYVVMSANLRNNFSYIYLPLKTCSQVNSTLHFRSHQSRPWYGGSMYWLLLYQRWY
jgi:hypothetical protein